MERLLCHPNMNEQHTPGRGGSHCWDLISVTSHLTPTRGQKPPAAPNKAPVPATRGTCPLGAAGTKQLPLPVDAGWKISLVLQSSSFHTNPSTFEQRYQHQPNGCGTVTLIPLSHSFHCLRFPFTLQAGGKCSLMSKV